MAVPKARPRGMWFERQPVVFIRASVSRKPQRSIAIEARHRQHQKRLKTQQFSHLAKLGAAHSRRCRRGGESTSGELLQSRHHDDCWRAGHHAPFITLFHFDMPMVMQEEKAAGENRDVVEAFGRSAQTCFALCGDRVKHWFTFNEPIIAGGRLFVRLPLSQCGGFLNVRPPWRTIPCYGASTRACWRAGRYDDEIGVVLNRRQILPIAASRRCASRASCGSVIQPHSFLDPGIKGRIPGGLVALLKPMTSCLPVSRGDHQLIADAKSIY